MRLAFLFGFLCLSQFVFCQTKSAASERAGELRFSAGEITHDNGVITMKGNVCVTMDGVFVYADEAVYDLTTGALTPQGHVWIQIRHFKAMPARTNEDEPSDPTDTPLRIPRTPWNSEGK